MREKRVGVIIDELRTRNGTLLEQTVRLTDNGSRYQINGINVVEGATIGKTRVAVVPMSRGYATAVERLA
jgi:hypothetical protein